MSAAGVLMYTSKCTNENVEYRDHIKSRGQGRRRRSGRYGERRTTFSNGTALPYHFLVVHPTLDNHGFISACAKIMRRGFGHVFEILKRICKACGCDCAAYVRLPFNTRKLRKACFHLRMRKNNEAWLYAVINLPYHFLLRCAAPGGDALYT